LQIGPQSFFQKRKHLTCTGVFQSYYQNIYKNKQQKIMKKLLFILAIAITSVNVSSAQVRGRVSFDVIIGSRPPAPNELVLMQAEEARYPNITNAMRGVRKAMDDLNNAPGIFGGHKAQAAADLKKAWISLRKALYFQLYEDTGH
jgi:hypothetical protein